MMKIDTISPPIGDAGQLSVVKKAVEAEPKSIVRESRPVQLSVKVEQFGTINSDKEVDEENARKSTPEQVDKAVTEVNDFFQNEQRKLSFSVNEALEGVVIEVKNSDTDEVIRQIPPESVVKLAERLSELNAKDTGIVGVFLKERA